jgi:hypothetical protein
MSIPINIGNNSFSLPKQGEAPNDKGSKRAWGENLSDIIQALTDIVNTLQGPDDIPESAENLLNTAGAKEIVSFHFDSNSVRSFEASYNISRKITKKIVSWSGDGAFITVTVDTIHNLRNGDVVTISGVGNVAVDGVRTITKLNTTQFKFSSATIGSASSLDGSMIVELLEAGTLIGRYGLQGWELSQTYVGDSQVEFDVNGSGTVTYNPVVLLGKAGTYSGLIKFLAKSILNN